MSDQDQHVGASIDGHNEDERPLHGDYGMHQVRAGSEGTGDLDEQVVPPPSSDWERWQAIDRRMERIEQTLQYLVANQRQTNAAIAGAGGALMSAAPLPNDSPSQERETGEPA